MFHTARSVFCLSCGVAGAAHLRPARFRQPRRFRGDDEHRPHAVGADSISARSSGRLRVSRGPGMPGPYRYTKLQHTQPR